MEEKQTTRTPAEMPVPERDAAAEDEQIRPTERDLQEPLPSDLASLVEDMETYDLVVEVEALERETNRLADIVIPSLEQHAERVGQVDQEVDALFTIAYEDPASARARFDQTAILQDSDKAARTIREAPAEYGSLNGGRFRIRQNQQVRGALAALEHRAAAYHRALDVAGPVAPDRDDPAVPSGSDGLDGPSPSHPEADDIHKEANDAFDRKLEQLYEHPAAARTNFDAIEQRLGTDRAAFGLAQSPEGLGALKPEVSRSQAVRTEYARAAALAASDSRRFGHRRGAHVPSHDAALRAAHHRLRVLRARAFELNRRIDERTSTSDAMRGRSRGQMRQSLEERLRDLDVDDRRRVVDAFAGRLASRGRTASLEPRGYGGLRGPTRGTTTTVGAKATGVGRAVRGVGVGSAALSIAVHVAERSLRRGAEEITGRETFSR